MIYHYTLASFFKEIADTHASMPALKYAEQSYSYQKVAEDSSVLAGYLLKQNIKRGDVIALINSKNYVSYIIMLACLKIGVTYTNIDPDAPAEWFANIISTCKPKKIFTDSDVTENLVAGSHIAQVTIESAPNLQDLSAYHGHGFIEPAFDGDAVAYIMFTSGSTGKPKGVAITQQSLIHFINWSVTRYAVRAGDVFANVSPMYFDNSVFDFYSALFSGACLAPINKRIVAAPQQLLAYVEQVGCTIWFSVPSLLIYLMTTKVLRKDSFAKLRVITFGGEGYPKVELKKLYDLYHDRITIINVYGPTECTCICSSYQITDKDFNDLNMLAPLGTINQNITYLILNEQGEPADTGELCLLGPNVAVGYYNDFERTAASFFYYTGHGYYQTRMYRTGDLVKQQQGLLHFIGRKDNQIKHMGYRIELEAIEIAIGKIIGINEVAVVYHKSTSAYGKIVAFIGSHDKTINANFIKQNLKTVLPDYMMPNQCEFFDYLPKNANGKIDRVTLKSSLAQENSRV